jgi:hypothetical protein
MVPLPLPFPGLPLLGFILLFTSLLNLSILLQPEREEISEVVSRGTKKAREYALIIFPVFLYFWVVVTWHIIKPSYLATILVDMGIIIIWIVLMYFNTGTMYGLIKKGYRPVLSKNLLDIILYIAVLYLILERIDIPWFMAGVIITIASLILLYCLYGLIVYRKLLKMLVEPVNLYFPALGLRVFSSLIGLTMILSADSSTIIKEGIVASYIVLSITLWYILMDLRPLIKKSA